MSESNSEYFDFIHDHMELQKRLMKVCGVYEFPKNEQLEVTLLNIARESIEAMGFVLDKTKPWKDSDLDLDNVKEEVIDVYHFWLQLLAIYDLYDSVNDKDFGYIDYVSSEIGMLKSALKTSGSEALDLSDWNDAQSIKWFALDQWERFLTMFFCLNMTPEDVDALYRAKNARNFERIKEKMDERK